MNLIAERICIIKSVLTGCSLTGYDRSYLASRATCFKSYPTNIFTKCVDIIIINSRHLYGHSGGEHHMSVSELLRRLCDYRTLLGAYTAVPCNNSAVKFIGSLMVQKADGLDALTHYNTDGAVRLQSNVGEAMGDWYAWTWKKDDNGNYLIGADGLRIADKTEMHKVANAMPKLTGGFGTSLSYKNWSLDMTFDFRIGGSVLNLPWQYMMSVGNITDAVGVRDAASGGIFYYSDTDNVNDKGSLHRVDPSTISNYKRGETMIDGHYVWDNGLILNGVKEDGTPHDIIVTQFAANDGLYGWGSGATQSYADAIQKNTYVKCREISLAYTLPASLTKKFACNNLTVSAFARNPFYIYRSLKLFDAETSDGTNWIYQSIVGGSTASSRTFGISLRASF